MMSDSSFKLWLNWEAFEVAAVCPIFATEISLEKIRKFASNFEDLRSPISIKQWIDIASTIFPLATDHLALIYSALEAFLLRDTHIILYRSRIKETSEATPILKVTDILCYLFLMYVKKKYRNISEVSSLEQFPSKKEPERLSPRQRVFSSSTPTVGAKLQIQSNKPDNSQYALMLYFFNQKLLQFIQIFAPNGITSVELDSLSFLVCGGPTITSHPHLLSKLITAEGLTPQKLSHIIQSNLTSKDQESFTSRIEAPPTSPLTYRPQLLHHNLATSPRSKGAADKPILIADMNDAQKIETPTNCPVVHIHNCKHFRGYFCGVVSSIFISHCKDSIVFVGAALAVHMEYCANVTIVAATRLLHLDACARCSVYTLTNNRPLITGNCTKISLAPYNALYIKFPSDILVAGIDPTNNRWKEPLVLGSFGQQSASPMAPSQFNLFPVPFLWDRQAIPVSPDLPQEYAEALQEKKRKLCELKENLDRIRAINPDLAAKLADQIKSTASKWIQEEGHMQEITWMYSLDQQ